MPLFSLRNLKTCYLFHLLHQNLTFSGTACSYMAKILAKWLSAEISACTQRRSGSWRRWNPMKNCPGTCVREHLHQPACSKQPGQAPHPLSALHYRHHQSWVILYQLTPQEAWSWVSRPISLIALNTVIWRGCRRPASGDSSLSTFTR